MKKIATIKWLIILITALTASSSYAWKNPFQNQQNNVLEKYGLAKADDREEEPSYNITMGSIFGIYVEPGIDPINEFERKPDIYITYESGDLDNPKDKKTKIKILTKDSHYPNGKLEFPCQLLVCEWTKKLTPGTYELWVKPKNNGDKYDPCQVTGSFTLNKPVIQKVEQIDGENDKLIYVKVTGLYFSITPNVNVFYTKASKKGKLIKIKKKCKIVSKTIDRVTGESEAIFTFKKRKNTSWELAKENGEPLIEVTNKVGSNRSTAAGNSWFTDADYGDCADPAFGDLDSDGDLDMVVGVKDGTFNYYENTGTTQAPVFTQRLESDNPFTNIDLYAYGCPWLADLDADGDLDLLAGGKIEKGSSGKILYFENTGSATSPNFEERTESDNPFNVITGDSFCNPTTVDLDNDGDLDLIFTCRDKNIYYYVNSGSTTNPVFEEKSGDDNPFSNIKRGRQTTAALADLDNDGDYDLVVSDVNGDFIYFANTGTVKTARFTSQTTNPFAGFDVGARGTPVFANLNGDIWPELVCGSRHGTLYCFQNDTRTLRTYTKQNKIVLSLHYPYNYLDPCFGDLDGDGDPDLVIGNSYGTFLCFLYDRITTSGHILFYEQFGEDNPFFGVDVGNYSSPFLADVDGDGDLDMISGHRDKNAGIIYFKNVGTVYKPEFVQQSADNNPFSHILSADATLPSMADLDGDGDLDLIVGHWMNYYENTGTATNPVFEYVDRDNSPLKDIRDYYFFSSAFGDTDNDGDLDLIAGYYSPTIAHELFIQYDNIGTKTDPLFNYYDFYRNYTDDQLFFNPSLVDVNRDGVLDIVYGCNGNEGRFVELRGSLNTVISFY